MIPVAEEDGGVGSVGLPLWVQLQVVVEALMTEVHVLVAPV